MTAAMRSEEKYYEMIMLYANTERQICQEGDRSKGACRRARHLRSALIRFNIDVHISDKINKHRQDQ